MVVARCLSSEEIKGLRELFKTIDANNDGTITVEELKVGLHWKSRLSRAVLKVLASDGTSHCYCNA